MRVSLAVVVAISVSGSLHGQGRVNFTDADARSPEHKIYVDEWLNPSALAPSGTQFLVALYLAAIDDESSLVQVGPAVGFFGSLGERSGMFLGGGWRDVMTLSCW